MPLVQRIRECIQARLASNFTTTLATNTNTLLSFTINPNEVWVVDCQMTTQCSGTGGVKYQLTTPGSCTVEGWLHSSLAAITTLSYQRFTAINTLGAATHTVATTPGGDTIRFTVTAAATGGTVAIGAASTTAGQTTTIFAGSWLTARRVV